MTNTERKIVLTINNSVEIGKFNITGLAKFFFNFRESKPLKSIMIITTIQMQILTHVQVQMSIY